MSRYWEEVRALYAPFEIGLKAPSAEVYAYEMPGGQYTNLFQQAKALGLASRWPEVCKAYADVNMLFGDIVKVTPIVEGRRRHGPVPRRQQPHARPTRSTPSASWPSPRASSSSSKAGSASLPAASRPRSRSACSRAVPRITERPGKNQPPADLAAATEKAAVVPRPRGERPRRPEPDPVPRVFPDYAAHERTYSDTSILPTPLFFFGPEPAAENLVEIEPGKTLIVKLLAVGEAHADGQRTVFFELNGQPREVEVVDRSLASAVRETPKADPTDPNQIAAPLPGLVVGVAVNVGDPVRKGQKLLSIEAMKMETTLYAERPGRVGEVLAEVGQAGEDGRAVDPVDQMTESDDWPVFRHVTLDSTSDEAQRMVEAGRGCPVRGPCRPADEGPGPGRELLVVRRGERSLHGRDRPHRPRTDHAARAAPCPGRGAGRHQYARLVRREPPCRDPLAERR